jgi:hypothetical protein
VGIVGARMCVPPIAAQAEARIEALAQAGLMHETFAPAVEA